MDVGVGQNNKEIWPNQESKQYNDSLPIKIWNT